MGREQLQLNVDKTCNCVRGLIVNNIFGKNINALREKNSNLADKLLKYILTDVPQLVRENDFYNFTYKGNYLHNPANPLGEANEIFAMAENSPVAIHLIYGIGLGYLFQVTSAKSQGTVILYEPDLNILRTAFSLVDFTNDILKNNVFITNDFSEACGYIYHKSNMKNTPLLLSTTAYREMNEEQFNNMVTSLQQEVGRFSLDLKYTKEKFYPLILKIINNIPKLINEPPLVELKDVYKDKTAVVVSAGPTLDRNIETIKKYRDNIVLITVGTAIKALAKHNIKPDFLCIIESYDSSKQIAGLDLKDVYFITEPYANEKIRNFEFKQTFLHISKNLPINDFWCEISGVDNSEYISKGTVSYTALNTARILGCSKIVLVGQDLAYIEGQCYSKDSAYKNLVCKYNDNLKKWEITADNLEDFAYSLSNNDDAEFRKQKAIERINNLNSSLYYVKGINGDMIPTESVYAAFIQPLSDFTQKYPDCEYINTSLVGAQIDGFKNISLEEALKDSEKIENRDIKTEFKYDIQSIKDNIFKAKENLKPAQLIIDELRKIGKNLNNDIKRYKNITPEILKGLKKLVTGYSALGYDFSSKNKLFDYITTAERIDLDYEMKMTTDFTIETVTNIIQKTIDYTNLSETKINVVTGEIDRILGEI